MYVNMYLRIKQKYIFQINYYECTYTIKKYSIIFNVLTILWDL